MNTETQASSEQTQGCCRGRSLLHSTRLHGAFTLALILLSAFLFAVTINALKEYRYIGTDVAPVNVINVSGEGEVFAVPDTAEFTFSVYKEGETAAAVQEDANNVASAVIDALKERGIEESDIKTVSYELQPKYEWEDSVECLRYPCPRTQVQKGFTLSQTVRVKVEDLDMAGELLGLVTDRGVSNVSSLNFTIADEDGLRADARKLAIDEARTKAEELARDLGVSLGRIVSFNENNYAPMPYFARDAMNAPQGLGEAVVEVSVPAGENRITSNVHITFEIR